MKVIVWQSYGDPQVYAIDTEKQIKNIIDKVKKVATYYTDDMGANELADAKTIEDIYDWIEMYAFDDENFEQFEPVVVRES